MTYTPPNGPRLLASGESVSDRQYAASASPTPVSGTLHLVYFTALRTETVTRLRSITRGTAAAGLTLARLGLYSVDSAGNLTLVGATASDTTLFTAAFTGYTKTMTSSPAKVAGQRYAMAWLLVGTTMPILYGNGNLLNTGSEQDVDPRITGQVTGQTDLPASVTTATVTTQTTTGMQIYGAVLP